jgi:glucosamine--fructose-6-phosphate aminotransferase (isomerizing)
MASFMRAEINQIPEACARLIDAGRPALRAAAKQVRAHDPAFLATVARGSSDHACTYFKYTSELLCGLPVASIGPSVASVYGAELKLGRSATIAVSQSGQSPDIIEMTRAARAQGAATIALTNTRDAPLSEVADCTLELHAGPEQSVAATKTFVSSALALAIFSAELAGDEAFLDSLHSLPDALDAATRCDWSDVAEAVIPAGSLFCLGRGPSWAIAGEAALKFKETAQIHAESYSSAEVMHGPVSIVERGFPILAFTAADAAERGVVDVARAMAAKGARVFTTSPDAPGALPTVRTGHPLTDPLALIVSFYGLVEAVSAAKGLDPDHPPHLRKKTATT